MSDTAVIQTRYDVEVVGQIWQPGVTAAMSFKVKSSDLPEYRRAGDETDIEYEARMVQCATPDGDFSYVEGWWITRHEQWHESPEPAGVHERELGESTTYTRKDRYTTLIEFTEEQAAAYDDCMMSSEYQ